VALSLVPTARPATITPAAGELLSVTVLDRLGAEATGADNGVNALDSEDKFDAVAPKPVAAPAPPEPAMKVEDDPKPVVEPPEPSDIAPITLMAAIAAAASFSDRPVRPESITKRPLAEVTMPDSTRPLPEKSAT
jgi:hypothetical protein